MHLDLHARDGFPGHDPEVALLPELQVAHVLGLLTDQGRAVSVDGDRIEPGDHLFADFGVLGIVDVRFSD